MIDNNYLEIFKSSDIDNLDFDFYYIKFDRKILDALLSVLRILQDDYSVLSYFHCNYILTTTNEYISTNEDDTIITKVSRMMLTKHGFSGYTEMIESGFETEFNGLVVKKINEIYGYNWKQYYPLIKIVVDANSFIDDMCKILGGEVYEYI